MLFTLLTVFLKQTLQAQDGITLMTSPSLTEYYLSLLWCNGISLENLKPSLSRAVGAMLIRPISRTAKMRLSTSFMCCHPIKNGPCIIHSSCSWRWIITIQHGCRTKLTTGSHLRVCGWFTSASFKCNLSRGSTMTWFVKLCRPLQNYANKSQRFQVRWN